MTQHRILDTATHRDLRVRTDVSAAYGDAVMACLAVPDEFRQVQAHYPILFRRNVEDDSFMAVALFGFENGENLFLSDGQWDAAYRPLAHAVQPFLVGLHADGKGDPQVHIDMGHPRVIADGAQEGGPSVALFDEQGRPSPYLEDMTERLGALHHGYQASPAFFAALKRYELLEPFTLEVPLADGSRNSLVGFHIIDEDRLRALDGAALADLHEGGHLMPIFMALASIAQFGPLIARKNRRSSGG
ncbi:MAG: SapC family protein [Sphingorhabdus sp.]